MQTGVTRRENSNKDKDISRIHIERSMGRTCFGCYAPDASMSHFAFPGTLNGGDSILEFFKSNPSEYTLDLQFTLVELGDAA